MEESENQIIVYQPNETVRLDVRLQNEAVWLTQGQMAILFGCSVDFFIQTETPSLQGVFYDGQLWDARALVLKLIGSAKKSLILIDNWTTTETLDLFTKKRKGVDNVANVTMLPFINSQFPVEVAA